MADILRMINEALENGFADEEISDLVNSIQDENRKRMERMAQTRAKFSGKPAVFLDGERVWELGGRRYAVMTETGAVKEVTLSENAPKPKRIK
jgi:hypothetical protein